MQKITPFLWFNDNAEEALNFYTTIFKDSRVISTTRYGAGGPFPAGMLMTATIELASQQFMLLNAGPQHKFTEAISFYVNCQNQAEVDEFWEKLSAGGEQGRCGWLKDRFGLSWQIIPDLLSKLLSDPDPIKSQKVVQAMLQMDKIDINALQLAYEQ